MAKQSRPPASDLGLILFSLSLGFIVWVIVKQQETTARALTVPIEYTNLPPYVDLENYSPKSISVDFSFPKAEERLIRNDLFKLTVDLRTLEQSAPLESFSDISVPINTSMIEGPKDATRTIAERILDSTSIIFRAKLRARHARVVARIEGRPAEGFLLEQEEVIVDPQVVQILVDSRWEAEDTGEMVIETEPIHIEGKKATVAGIYAIAPSSDSGTFSIPGQPVPKVHVTVPLAEQEETAGFDSIPVIYEPLRLGVLAEIVPSSVRVRVVGPRSVVRSITPEMIRVDPRSLIEELPGSVVESLLNVSIESGGVDLARELRVVEAEPRTVRFRIYTPGERSPQTSPVPTPSPTFTPAPTPAPIVLPTASPSPLPTPSPAPSPTPQVEIDDQVTSDSVSQLTPTPTPFVIPALPTPFVTPKATPVGVQTDEPTTQTLRSAGKRSISTGGK